jgi:hypothetical protein
MPVERGERANKALNYMLSRSWEGSTALLFPRLETEVEREAKNEK